MVLHPNAGAVLVVGLGCENNQPDVFREFIGSYDEDRIRFMVAQKVDDEYEEGMRILRELYAKCCQDERSGMPSRSCAWDCAVAVPTARALRPIRCWACSPITHNCTSGADLAEVPEVFRGAKPS